jgi:hypothetical protein
LRPPILVPAEAPNTYLAARFYAALGMSVLPCTGKKPSIGWAAFQQRPATAETITRWHDVGLLENVGIICGKVSGNLVVMDLDGSFAIDAFDFQFPHLFNTYRVASGSGQGIHLYYYVGNLPPTTRITGSQHGNIELRANGCYVVAPPSIHPSGKPYTVAYAKDILWLPDMDEVVDWIKLLIRRKHGGQMPPPANGKINHKTAYGAAALRSEAAEVRLCIPGERNHRLYRAALKMGSLIADGKIDRAAVEQTLLGAARALSETDGEAATMRTITSGINRGLESSRDGYRNHA